MSSPRYLIELGAARGLKIQTFGNGA